MYFKVLMEMGHVGSGKSFEITRYIEADDVIALLLRVKDYPALKSKDDGSAIKLVKPVSKEEFEKGELMQQNDTYSKRPPRYTLNEKCVLEITSIESDSTLLTVTATDFSSKGLGIRYGDNQLSEDTKVLITIKSLNIINKRAIVLWSNSNCGISTSGLRFL